MVREDIENIIKDKIKQVKGRQNAAAAIHVVWMKTSGLTKNEASDLYVDADRDLVSAMELAHKKGKCTAYQYEAFNKDLKSGKYDKIISPVSP